MPGYEPLPEAERRAKAAALFPTLRGLASTDKPQLGHFTDSDVVLDFLAHSKLAALAELGTSCPDHFLRTKVKPMVVDLPSTASVEEILAALPALHEAYRADYAGYYQRNATPDSPAMRGADPAIVLVPGVGMFSFGTNKQTARVAGEFYVNAINVMRGAESVSTYAPISRGREVRHRVLGAGRGQAASGCPSRRRSPPGSRWSPAPAPASARPSPPASPPRAGASSSPTSTSTTPQAVAAAAGRTGCRRRASAPTCPTRTPSPRLLADAALAFGGVDLVVNNAGLSLSKPLLETTVARLGPAAQRDGQGQLPRLPRGRPGDDRPEHGRRHHLHLAPRTRVFAGPNNIAYSATKADQAHQVRLLAAELGQYGIRVNGINPDGVVRGSGIFAAGWGASRAAVYGVKEEDLGAYYAKRTLLGKEVLPDHIGDAVYALTAGDLSQTTGLHIPVDSGVAAAFLR